MKITYILLLALLLIASTSAFKVKTGTGTKIWNYSKINDFLNNRGKNIIIDKSWIKLE